MEKLDFQVRGEFVTLNALLKLTGQASSGGAAKMMVAQGLVQVNGQTELRKTCKLRPGRGGADRCGAHHGARARMMLRAAAWRL